MPRLDLDFTTQASRFVAIVSAGEITRSSSQVGSPPHNHWTVPRLEALYELAYLRTFIAWESFLEESFYRYLCGFTCRHAPPAGGTTLVAGPYKTIALAEAAVMGTQTYIAWYRNQTVLNRCRAHINNGLHEYVFNSNLARLQNMSAIRHRVAHGQKDAMVKFDQATMALTGRRYRGSRPGSFLRDWTVAAGVRRRWLEVLISDLTGMAGQIT